jgi:hypothetical protein
MDVCVSQVQSQDNTTRQFALWAMESLGLDVTRQGDLYTLTASDDRAPRFEGRASLDFSFVDPSAAADAEHRNGRIERLALGAPLFDWLLEQLERRGGPVDARPRHQPESVHEITSGLFAAYSVDGGGVHLAGCSLDERPFARLTYAATGDARDPSAVAHVLVDSAGQLVSDSLADALGLVDLAPWEQRPPRRDALAIAALVDAGRRLATQRLGVAPSESPLAVALAWCTFVEGRLRFEIGGATADLPFSGWARTLQAPPFVCPATGATGLHVAATDDGKVTLAEQIATCEISGRRMLVSELAACAATGKRVAPEFTIRCPILEQPVLADHTLTCAWCQQSVSETATTGGVCRACREMKSVGKDDPRLARILGEHPGLDAWRSWKLSETAETYIARGSGLFRQVLVVVDKASLDVLWVAQRSRLAGAWTPPPEAIRDEMLR